MNENLASSQAGRSIALADTVIPVLLMLCTASNWFHGESEYPDGFPNGAMVTVATGVSENG